MGEEEIQRDVQQSPSGPTQSTPTPKKDLSAGEEPCEMDHELPFDVDQTKPKEGMEFNDLDAVYDFYNKYGAKSGFSVRKSKIKRKNGVITFRKFCCSKEGYRLEDKRDTKEVHHRPQSRTGCLACLQVKLQHNGKYRIMKVELKHNHDVLTPEKSHMLRSQRHIMAVQKADVDSADKSTLKPKELFAFQATQIGGRENLGFLSVDLKNHLRTSRQKELKNEDAAYVLEYFQRKQMEDPLFFYAIQIDKDGLITNIFWTDARSILDYDHFGDVVCFDTTYKANNYRQPFALFIGVNHHKQSIIFGTALLYDETVASFKWLFESFLEAMSGVAPKTILTDQCAAMSTAIELVFPSSCHRLCIWHIYQNATINLKNVFAASSKFASDFSNCIYDHEDEQNFIDAWNDMLQKYGLTDNIWLSDLFNEKEKWALVYGQNTFCADMASTQRSESFNYILKRYLDSENNLLKFLEHYDRVITDRRHDEYFADFKTSRAAPVVCASLMLKQAAEVYTQEAYKTFEIEFKKYLDCVAFKSSTIGMVEEYDVKMFNSERNHSVTYDLSTGSVACSCQKYEFTGILCSHALKVLDQHQVKLLPSEYIMKRWTRNAKSSAVNLIKGGGFQCDPKTEIGMRYGSLCRKLVQIAMVAAEDDKAYTFAMDHSSKFLEEVVSLMKDAAISNTRHDVRPNISDSSLGIGKIIVNPDVAVESTSMNVIHDCGLHEKTVGIKKRKGGTSQQMIKGPLEKVSRMKKGNKKTQIQHIRSSQDEDVPLTIGPMQCSQRASFPATSFCNPIYVSEGSNVFSQNHEPLQVGDVPITMASTQFVPRSSLHLNQFINPTFNAEGSSASSQNQVLLQARDKPSNVASMQYLQHSSLPIASFSNPTYVEEIRQNFDDNGSMKEKYSIV